MFFDQRETTLTRLAPNQERRNESSKDLARSVRSRKRIGEASAFFAVLVVGFLIRIPGILANGFISDESVYDYAAYAIGRGVIPYSQIMLPHPPLGYLFLVPALLISQGTLLILRIFNLLTFLAVAGIAYWLFRILRQVSPLSFNPLLAFALFTLYPLPFATTTPIEFTIFDIPILLGTVFFVKGLIANSSRRLLLSGALVGVGLMIWFTAAFFAASLVGFLVLYRWRRRGKGWLGLLGKQAGAMILGGIVIVGVVAAMIVSWGALSSFLVQSVGLQTSLRASFTFPERIYHIFLAILQLLPMFVLAGVGVFEIVRRSKSGVDPLVLLPAWILIVNLVLVFTVPRIVLNHYVAYLMPFLVLLAAGSIEKLAQTIRLARQELVRPIPWDLFHSALAVILIVSAFLAFPLQTGYLVNSPYTLADQSVGHYVAGLTIPADAIWTSEGSIAYFAGRPIQAPNSAMWPFQAEYNDIFNTTYVDADGVVQHGLAAVTPAEFISAWQIHGTRVLVFIIGDGPVPYPDSLLWNGFSGTIGVSQYVSVNYRLVQNFTFTDVKYQYLVWLKD